MSQGKVLLKVLMAGTVFLLCSCVQMPRNSHPITLGWKDLLEDDLSNCAFCKHALAGCRSVGVDSM